MEKRFENFTIGILTLNRLMQKIKLLAVKGFNLKAIHVMCVYFLNETPDLTASELVKLTREDKGAISRALVKLKDDGFITYNPNRYNSKIKLTDSGKMVAEHIVEASRLAVDAGGATLSDEDRATFYKALSEICDNLEKYYDGLIANSEVDSDGEED
jgi:DNA-binding MarR family transcriptional regulator